MSQGGEFDIKQFLQMDSPKNTHEETQSAPPYPDHTPFAENGHVQMPEAEPRSTPFYLQEPASYRPQRGPQLDLNIPSITVQADEQRSIEIYSPLNQSPYEAEASYSASYDVSSPYNQSQYLGSAANSAAASPSAFEGSGDEAWDYEWQEQQIGDMMGEFWQAEQQGVQGGQNVPGVPQIHPSQGLPQGLPQGHSGQPNLNLPESHPASHGPAHTLQNLGLQGLQGGLAQPPGHPQGFQGGPSQVQLQAPHSPTSFPPHPGHPSGHPSAPAQAPSPASLQVPGSEHYAPSSPDYYLSAPSSPSMGPTSPSSGRASPLLRRPRAYSSPYDLSTDGDASSPGDTGLISGNKRRTKKNPSLYPCNQCDKKFTRAYNLRSHMRTHTHERPFACAVCGKAFARQHDRKRHEDLHTGEKRFVCQGQLQDQTPWGCGRKFARADALGRHFRTEAGKTCMAPLREDAIAKVGQRAAASEGIVFLGVFNGEAKLDVADPTDDGNQTRRAVIMSALAEQLSV